jgi:hypothetical protein
MGPSRQQGDAFNMMRQREGVEHPNGLNVVAIVTIKADVAGECRSLATDMDHPRHAGAGEQFDDRSARACPRRVEYRDIGSTGLRGQHPAD